MTTKLWKLSNNIGRIFTALDVAEFYAPTSRLVISQILNKGPMNRAELTDSLLSNPDIPMLIFPMLRKFVK